MYSKLNNKEHSILKTYYTQFEFKSQRITKKNLDPRFCGCSLLLSQNLWVLAPIAPMLTQALSTTLLVTLFSLVKVVLMIPLT